MKCGATIAIPQPAPWTTTLPGSGPSWSATRRSPSTSRPFMVLDTSSFPDRRRGATQFHDISFASILRRARVAVTTQAGWRRILMVQRRNNMKMKTKLSTLLAACALTCVVLAAETGAELFQKAVTQERAAGNLEEAIKLYQRVAREFASDRPLAAKALVQAARCYEKLGQDKSIKLYEQVTREFADQREPAATARDRLTAIRAAAKPKTASGMVARQLPASTGRLKQSDGRHIFYVSAAGLMATEMD